MQLRIRGPSRGPLVRLAASPFVAAEFIRDPVRYAECDAVRVLVGIEAHLERFEVPHGVNRLRDESVMVVVVRRRGQSRRGPDEADEDQQRSQVVTGHPCLQ